VYGQTSTPIPYRDSPFSPDRPTIGQLAGGLDSWLQHADRVEQSVLRTHEISHGLTDHSITGCWLRIYQTGLDLWLLTPFVQQRFNIMNPSEIEVRCLPLVPLDAVHEPEGEGSIHDVRHAVREGLNAEAVLRQVVG
jgi:hypothetical protein